MTAISEPKSHISIDCGTLSNLGDTQKLLSKLRQCLKHTITESQHSTEFTASGRQHN